MAAELGKVYQIVDTRAYSTAITILQARAHATRNLAVMRAWATCDSTVTTGTTIQLLRQTTAGTMTTLSPGPLGMRPNSGTAGFTAGRTATVEPTASDILFHEEFSRVNGWLYLPTQDEQIIIPAAGFLGMKFSVAPSPSATWTYGMVLVEMG